MGLGTLIVVSCLSAAELIYILYSFNPDALKTALGYKVYIDLVYGLGITAYMAMSGTISGVVIAAISGACMTASLTLMAAIYGYYKREKLADGSVIWIEYKPTLTKQRIKDLFEQMRTKVIILKQKYT